MMSHYPKKTRWENFCHKLKNFDWGIFLLILLVVSIVGAMAMTVYVMIKQAGEHSEHEAMMAAMHCQQTEKQRFVNTTEVGSAMGVNPATGGVVVGTTLSPGVKVENMWSCDGGVTIWK